MNNFNINSFNNDEEFKIEFLEENEDFKIEIPGMIEFPAETPVVKQEQKEPKKEVKQKDNIPEKPTIQMISAELLKENLLNREFFDDIEGRQWEEFLESIRTSGILTPLIVTDDYTVVSGSQRLRAARELGLKEVPCIVKEYKNKDGIKKEDWILKELLEVNYRQRGIANLNPIKVAKGILELERIYEIQRGNNQYLRSGTSLSGEPLPKKSQSEIMDTLGIKKSYYYKLKRLNELIPAIQQLVRENKIPVSVATEIAYLEPSIQELLYKTLKEDIMEISMQEVQMIREQAEKDMQDLIDQLNELIRQNREKDLEIKQKEDEIKQKETLIEQYKTAIEFTNEQLKKLQNKPIEKIEVIPDNIKQEIENLKKQQENIYEKLKQTEEELKKAKQEYEQIKQEKENYKTLWLKEKNGNTQKLWRITESLENTKRELEKLDLDILASFDEQDKESFLNLCKQLKEMFSTIISKIDTN
ncbi:ParB domain protein nuclease [Thermoanaerobacter ethanolicus JW 200]|uniref:ParB/RepB/Spo0J family partition protein n=1 Tax=Thermoanaerobacter ethanolicus TaxID=1757 RepID=UPI000202D80A|nr:ParB domain protein nuclease [Thermoanaerobacter ethanolicus JW 200]